MSDDAKGPGRGRGAVCRACKTKMLYVVGPEALERQSATASYLCTETMRTFGPDDALVAPDLCRAGRECFEG